MAIAKLLVLFTCVVLSVYGEVAPEASTVGPGDVGNAGGDHAEVLQRALDALQAMLASTLAMPAQLWATHAEEVRARIAALQDQVSAAKEQVSAALAAVQQKLAASVQQHAATPAAARAVEDSKQQSAETQDSAVARALLQLASASAQAQKELAKLWPTPGPTTTPAPSH